MVVLVFYVPVVGGIVAQVPCRYGDLSQVGGIVATIEDRRGIVFRGGGDLPLRCSVTIACVRIGEIGGCQCGGEAAACGCISWRTIARSEGTLRGYGGEGGFCRPV